MSETHDWELVAPWYRWPRQQQQLGLAPRQTRPVLQKYEDPKLVDAFLTDPQHSLVFDDDDFVYQTTVLPGRTVASGPMAGQRSDLAVKSASGRFERYLATKTSMRKLFLDAHKRHYLVVCELHCDVAGFPSAKRDDVCQAGFVVRRRYTSYPASAEADAAAILKKISKLQLELAKLERVPAAKRALRRWESFPAPNANGAVKARKDELQLAINIQRKQLRHWAGVHGAEEAHLGWIASERKGVGMWQVVEEEPQYLLEDFYPLYPLVPSPNDPDNSGTGTTMYFGIVPTSSSDTDPTGAQRYDDHHLYEIRCFVRRHKPTCPRTLEPNDCNGELFWSKATETFQFASHFDPVGSANRPINVQLPDFPALAAHAAARPVGALAPVRMNTPSRSSLQFASDPMPPTSGSVGDGQICFLAIPLITIVASFVLNLFLPIVTFVFGLWFLLRLKICIPPSLSVSAGIDLELSAAASINLDIDVAVDVNVPFQGSNVVVDAATLKSDLLNQLVPAIGPDAQVRPELSKYAPSPLAELQQGMSKPQKGPDFGSASLVWEVPVPRSAVELVLA